MGKKFSFRHISASVRQLAKGMPERDVMIVLSLVVGIACGLAAILLKSAVELIHHSITSWFDGMAYSILYLVYPGIGMLIAMLFVRYVVKDNIGHGVTKVLQAVSKKPALAMPAGFQARGHRPPDTVNTASSPSHSMPSSLVHWMPA